ncbi:MAG: hypothetical protein VYD89_04960, partial [Candidatus Thermoplasmatota archaeon]|nr:hypothetical protein [Candidatus Thermoplasmatota archaeon]
MTDVIDLRGSGIVARAGLEAPVQKGMASLERLSELFETGHDGLAADMLRKRNNSNPTNEGLEMAVNMGDNFTESEMRRWFRELEGQDVGLSEALLDFKFNLFSEADPAVAANTAFQLYESGILDDASKMEASEMLLEYGSPDKAILMIGSIENIEFRVAASQLATTAAKAIKNIESQADAWRL